MVAGSDSDERRSLEGRGGEEGRGCAVMREMKKPEDSGDPPGGREETPRRRANTAPKAHPPGFQPWPAPPGGWKTDWPYFQKVPPALLSEGKQQNAGWGRAYVIASPGPGNAEASPGPGPCSSGSWAAVFSTFYFRSPLSTARKTPRCMSASPPRVPRSTMSNTSTRYEPPCEKALPGHTSVSPVPGTEAAETSRTRLSHTNHEIMT